MSSLRRLSFAVLALSGLCLTAVTGRAVEPRLLPANTEVVFTINIKQMLESDIIKGQADAIKQFKAALEGQIPNSDEVAKYLEKMGFDPFRDLVSVSMAHPGTQDQTEGIIIIEGVFHAKKFAAAADDAITAYGNQIKKGGTVEGITYYEISIADKTAYVALVGKSIVISQQKENVTGAITRSTGNQIVAGKVRELLKTTNNQQSLSFVVTGGAINRVAQQAQGKIPPGLNLGGIEGLSGAITLTKDINFQLGVGTKDAMTAQQYEIFGKVGLDLAKGMVQKQAQQKPDLAPLIDVMNTLKVSSVGPNLVLTGSVSQENLEKLIKSAGKFKGGF
jgi:hypothetical protein